MYWCQKIRVEYMNVRSSIYEVFFVALTSHRRIKE